MKQLLNTLYVTTQGAYLNKDGETVVVNVEREARLRVPIHTLGSVVCFGQVSCSPPLMGLCAENGVSLAFFSESGRFLARVQGPVSGNVLLRREQYRRADNQEHSAVIARSVVIAKIANSRTVDPKSRRIWVALQAALLLVGVILVGLAGRRHCSHVESTHTCSSGPGDDRARLVA